MTIIIVLISNKNNRGYNEVVSRNNISTYIDISNRGTDIEATHVTHVYYG